MSVILSKAKDLSRNGNYFGNEAVEVLRFAQDDNTMACEKLLPHSAGHIN
ncbi:hypothetical protein [Hymenobacter fastidiosus]